MIIDHPRSAIAGLRSVLKFGLDRFYSFGVSCVGLQKLTDVCEDYGGLWDIKFNPAKSHVACFGFGNNLFCDISLNGSVVAMVDKVEYLSVYFERKSGQ